MNKICRWFSNGEGCCFDNGSRCDYPFSDVGCEIQDKNIFSKVKYPIKLLEFADHRYEPVDKEQPVIKINDIYKSFEIRKGDVIADYRIPFNTLEGCIVPSLVIDNAWKQVEQKFKDAGINIEFTTENSGIFYNVELIDGVTGIYIFGVKRGAR